MQCCIQSASLCPGRTDRDSGRTKFERVCQFGRTDRGFGHTKSKHWHPISGFRKFISNLANEIQVSAFKQISKMYSNANQMRELQRRHVFDVTDWCISIRVPGSASSAVVVYNSQKNQLILFPLTIKMKQATLQNACESC